MLAEREFLWKQSADIAFDLRVIVGRVDEVGITHLVLTVKLTGKCVLFADSQLDAVELWDGPVTNNDERPHGRANETSGTLDFPDVVQISFQIKQDRLMFAKQNVVHKHIFRVGDDQILLGDQIIRILLTRGADSFGFNVPKTKLIFLHFSYAPSHMLREFCQDLHCV